VPECDREASIMRKPWKTRYCCATGRNERFPRIVATSSQFDMKQSCNPRARFVVALRATCIHLHNTRILRGILSGVWLSYITRILAVLLQSYKHTSYVIYEKTGTFTLRFSLYILVIRNRIHRTDVKFKTA
jgi:hypothetical protein